MGHERENINWKLTGNTWAQINGRDNHRSKYDFGAKNAATYRVLFFKGELLDKRTDWRHWPRQYQAIEGGTQLNWFAVRA